MNESNTSWFYFQHDPVREMAPFSTLELEWFKRTLL